MLTKIGKENKQMDIALTKVWTTDVWGLVP